MRRGVDYLNDIRRDGRVVILDGEPIDDVTAHPGFAGAARTLASLYDASAERPDLISTDADGTWSAKWLIPRSAADVAQRTLVHRFWAEGTHGLMGRTPDHGAALLAGFAGRRDVFDRAGTRLGDRVSAFHREARRNDWHIAYAVTPPRVDRSKPAHLQPEPFLYPGIVRELDDGIIVRGAQMVVTSAAIADWLFVSTIAPLQPGDEDYAISVALPVGASGVRVHPRAPFTTASTRPFDAPLASRYDDGDCLVVLRDAFVPWEQVFVHRDISLVNAQFYETGANVLTTFQSLVRFAAKARFAAGLAISLADAHGTSGIPPVQAQLGADVAALCTAIEAVVLAAGERPVDHGGVLLPSPAFVDAGVSLQRRWVGDLMRALREVAGGAFMALPSEAAFNAPASAPDVARLYRSSSRSARDRVALLRTMWDLVGTEFGGRQVQYEMFSSAAGHVADQLAFRSFDWDAARAEVDRFLDDA